MPSSVGALNVVDLDTLGGPSVSWRDDEIFKSVLCFFLSIFAMNHPRSPFLVIPVDEKLWTELVLYVLFGKGRLALPEHEGKRVYE